MASTVFQEYNIIAQIGSRNKAAAAEHNSQADAFDSENDLQDRKVAVQNFARYLKLDTTIRKIASILDFEYVTPDNAFHRLRKAQGEEDSTTAGAAFPKYMFATLPFAMGLCPCDQVPEFVCAADMTARTFWEDALERLGAAGFSTTLMEYNKHLAVQLLKMRNEHIIRIEFAHSTGDARVDDFCDCVIVLRYHRKDEDFDQRFTAGRQVTKSMVRRECHVLGRVLEQQIQLQRCAILSAGAVCAFTGAPFRPRTKDAITPFFTQIPSKFLQRAFQRLHRWFYNMGFLSSRLGMLSTKALVIAWSHALHTLGPPKDTVQPGQLFQQCIDHLISRFGQALVTTPNRRLLLCYQTYEEPDSPISPEALGQVVALLRFLHRNPRKLLDFSSPTDGLLHFSSTYALFVKVDANCWIPRQRLRFADKFFEVVRKLQWSITLEIGIGKALARSWPFHLTWIDDQDEGPLTYLLGLYSAKEGVLPTPPDRLEEQSLTSHVNMLFDAVFATSEIDQSKCFVQCEIIDRDTLQTMLKSKAFIQRSIAPCRDLTKEALPEAEPVVGATESPPTKESRGQHQQLSARARGIPDLDAPSYFRDAMSAINRLLWDPNLRGIAYEVGYLDRFLPDLVWKSLDDWKQATEEEEFIPAHRVRQIRRRYDKGVVWDRRERIDTLTRLW